MSEDFYCRYYVGHRGRFGHEYMEFELYSDGRLRYANNSNYKNDSMIRKEAYVGPAVIAEVISRLICFYPASFHFQQRFIHVKSCNYSCR